MANIDKKPHLYRINGKWYCRKRYDIGFGGGVRTALGASRLRRPMRSWRGLNITAKPIPRLRLP